MGTYYKIRCKSSDQEEIGEHHFWCQPGRDIAMFPSSELTKEVFTGEEESTTEEVEEQPAIEISIQSISGKEALFDYEYWTCDQGHTHKYYLFEIKGIKFDG